MEDKIRYYISQLQKGECPQDPFEEVLHDLNEPYRRYYNNLLMNHFVGNTAFQKRAIQRHIQRATYYRR